MGRYLPIFIKAGINLEPALTFVWFKWILFLDSIKKREGKGGRGKEGMVSAEQRN